MRSWSGSRSCSTNTSGRTSRHRFLNKAGETDGPRNVARVLGDSLSVFECRATRHLSIYQQRGLTEFRRQLPGEVHAGYQAAFPNICLVKVAAAEAEVRDDELAFEVRHQKQSEDQGIEVPQLRPIDPREDLRVRIEREVCRVTENTTEDGRH